MNVVFLDSDSLPLNIPVPAGVSAKPQAHRSGWLQVNFIAQALDIPLDGKGHWTKKNSPQSCVTVAPGQQSRF
ncbi:hypothetical protein RGV33_12640 [Pseudomonas sp. Bout1]|uniref:hypothetical protein n=1 Tax=Pseudomonas sp. Bout1 TaxID=3048600 RepID=UPI002AB4446E|nr:hypothetical protein [Pseudomonas sp. Bout1]MDY7532516.1 hypothetical protein [Pseudomonas sp. Bout1]MEB0186278.1 hypothetical protein [Pseudomonas sp. Bout1]